MEVRTYPEYSKRYPLLLRHLMKRPLDLYPDDVAVVYRNDAGEYYRFTWRQWYRRTCQLAHALEKLGVKPGKPGEPGDRVATMALNHHRHLELCYASTCIGAVSHPINIELSLDDIAYIIKHAEDRVIFVDDVIMPLLELIYDQIKSTVKAFVYMSDRPGKPQTRIEPLYEYEELIKGQPEEYDWPYLNEHTYAALYYTTDTTGAPKGIMFTHRQLYLQTIHPVAGVQLNPIPWDVPEELPAIRVPLVNLPLSNIHAWGTPWYHVLAASRIVLPGRFTPQNFCELVETERVTSTVLVPTMLAALVEYKDTKKHDLSSLLAIGVVGGALPLGLEAKAEKLFPNAKISSGYGMTETAGLSIQAVAKRHMVDWPKKKLAEALVKTGLPALGIEAQVIGKDGKPVPNDDTTLGEIVLRGSWIMERYFKDPEKTAGVWQDGWFHTGDIAKVDKDGYVIVVDKKTDMIRSGSEIIPTVLLENIVASSKHVLEATFVGVPEGKRGDRPMAIIKLVPDAKVTEEDIYKFLEKEGVSKGKIAKWMLPDYIVFCDNIPKTSVGKFDKVAIHKKLGEFLAKAKKMPEP